MAVLSCVSLSLKCEVNAWKVVSGRCLSLWSFRNPVPSCAEETQGQRWGWVQVFLMPALAALLQTLFAAAGETASNTSKERCPFSSIHGPVPKTDSELSWMDLMLRANEWLLLVVDNRLWLDTDS